MTRFDLIEICKKEGLDPAFFVNEANSVVRELTQEIGHTSYLKEKLKNAISVLKLIDENEYKEFLQGMCQSISDN